MIGTMKKKLTSLVKKIIKYLIIVLIDIGCWRVIERPEDFFRPFYLWGYGLAGFSFLGG